jgi:transcriptional regulator
MYQPAHFVERDPAVLAELIRAAPLATLIRGGAELSADAIPLELDGDRLLGHVARANPLWREADGQPVLAVFHGVQAYITPSWYASKAADGRVVPTWNYAMVQAHGTLRAIEDTAWLEAFVTRLTDRHEAPLPAPWKVGDAPGDYVQKLLKAIVGIEIAVTRLEGKFKLSQNRPPEDRAGVIEGLGAHPMAVAVKAADDRRGR